MSANVASRRYEDNNHDEEDEEEAEDGAANAQQQGRSSADGSDVEDDLELSDVSTDSDTDAPPVGKQGSATYTKQPPVVEGHINPRPPPEALRTNNPAMQRQNSHIPAFRRPSGSAGATTNPNRWGAEEEAIPQLANSLSANPIAPPSWGAASESPAGPGAGRRKVSVHTPKDISPDGHQRAGSLNDDGADDGEGEAGGPKLSRNTGRPISPKSPANTAFLPVLNKKKMSSVNLRRQLSLRRTSDDMAALEAAAKGQDIETVIRPSNAKVKKVIDALRSAQAMFRRDFGEKQGAISDAGFQELREGRRQLELVKIHAAEELWSIAGDIKVLIIDNLGLKQIIANCIEELMEQGDKRGNGEMVAALMSLIQGIDFTTLILARQYVQFAVREGQPKFFDMFLSMPAVLQEFSAHQVGELVKHAAAHPIHRVALFTSMLKYVPTSAIFPLIKRDHGAAMQTALETIVTLAAGRVNPEEERAARPELISAAIRQLWLDFAVRASPKDRQTIFSRAAREGDAELLEAIIAGKRIEDINRLQADHTNALQQAVARGHYEAVAVLCKHPKIGPSLSYFFLGRGTALDIARQVAQTSKHPEVIQAIINTLKIRMAELNLMERNHVGDRDTPDFDRDVNKDGLLTEEHDGKKLTVEQRKDQAERLKEQTVGGLNLHTKAQTRNSSHVVIDRRKSSIAGGTDAKRKSVAAQDMKALEEMEAAGSDELVDATSAVRIAAAVVKPLYEMIQYEESFEPKGDDLKKVLSLKEDLQRAKESMTSKLERLGRNLELRTPQVRDDVIYIMDRMVSETSHLGGNPELFESILLRCRASIDFNHVANDKSWCARSAENGSLCYLDLLLTLESAKVLNQTTFQTKLVFEGAAASRIYRIDALLRLFDHEDVLNFDYFQAMLRPVWQTIFLQVASLATARPQELRGNRMELLQYMLTHPLVQCDPEKPDATGHSCFSRAILEDDAALVHFLINPPPSIKKKTLLPHPLAEYNGLTGLLHAIMNDRFEILQMLIEAATKGPLRPPAPADGEEGEVDEEQSILTRRCKVLNGVPLKVAIVHKKERAAAMLKAAGVTLRRKGGELAEGDLPPGA